MPSGSHRTHGGSHSSGGTRSSHTSSSRNVSTSSSHRPTTMHHGRIHHHWGWHRGGTSVHVSMGSAGTIIFLVIFALIFCGSWIAGGALFLNHRSNTLDKIESDYTYYQDMIAFAEEKASQGDNSYIIEGTIVDKFESDYKNKWYLVYKFEYLVFPGSSTMTNTVEGETYAIYTYEQSKRFHKGDKIMLATDSSVIDANTDTVNIDYKNTTLKDDGYYLETKNNLFPPILCFAVGGGVAILIVCLIVNQVKKKSNTPESIPSSVNDSAETTPTHTTKSRTTYCAYCGAEMSSLKRKCPECGAKNKH